MQPGAFFFDAHEAAHNCLRVARKHAADTQVGNSTRCGVDDFIPQIEALPIRAAQQACYIHFGLLSRKTDMRLSAKESSFKTRFSKSKAAFVINNESANYMRVGGTIAPTIRAIRDFGSLSNHHSDDRS